MDSIGLAVIVGSVREGRFGPVVAEWFAGQAKQRDDLSINVIDLADTPIPSTNFTSRIGAAEPTDLVGARAAARQSGSRLRHLMVHAPGS